MRNILLQSWVLALSNLLLEGSAARQAAHIQLLCDVEVDAFIFFAPIPGWSWIILTPELSGGFQRPLRGFNLACFFLLPFLTAKSLLNHKA